jgi:hypothetical protein
MSPASPVMMYSAHPREPGMDIRKLDEIVSVLVQERQFAQAEALLFEAHERRRKKPILTLL